MLLCRYRCTQIARSRFRIPIMASDHPNASGFQTALRNFNHQLDENGISGEQTKTQDKNHFVFVYGTLKSGEPNHYVLENFISKGQMVLLGRARTAKKWPLVIASKYNIPFLLNMEGEGNHVKGEVYRTSDEGLMALDDFENHPVLYQRKKEDVILLETNETLSVWIYLLYAIKRHLLDLPYLGEYSSKGHHGLEYVKGEELDHPKDI